MGSKIDARTYAIFVLAFVVATMTVTLVAQRESSGLSGSGDQAAATRQVAEATRAVAQSNEQIAAAISQLAESVKSFEDTYQSVADGQAAAVSRVRGVQAPAATTNTNSSDSGSAPEGVFELGGSN